MGDGPKEEDQLARWREEGFKPQLISKEGKWTVEFDADGWAPEWADWTDKEWHNTPEEAIAAALTNEQNHEAYARALDRDKT